MPTVAPGGQGLLAVDRDGYVIAFTTEVEGQRLAQRAVVLDDQDPSLQFKSSIWPVARYTTSSPMFVTRSPSRSR